MFEDSDSGTKENQPSRPDPSVANHPACMISPPPSQMKNPVSATRGAAIRIAPTCNGTRYMPIAIAIGVTNR